MREVWRRGFHSTNRRVRGNSRGPQGKPACRVGHTWGLDTPGQDRRALGHTDRKVRAYPGLGELQWQRGG